MTCFLRAGLFISPYRVACSARRAAARRQTLRMIAGFFNLTRGRIDSGRLLYAAAAPQFELLAIFAANPHRLAPDARPGRATGGIVIFGPDLSSAVPAVGREYVVQGEAELVDTRAYLGEDGFLGRPALVGQTGLEFDFEFLESLICNHFVTLSNF
uniref:Putative membrane transport-associated protein n=1 Tax=Burkholderia pseudomallei TaxID=28450 RepID=Q1ZZ85_BURPE|nr:putative membrane transport-associated protein [Burkholderia pseudomallei]